MPISHCRAWNGENRSGGAQLDLNRCGKIGEQAAVLDLQTEPRVECAYAAIARGDRARPFQMGRKDLVGVRVQAHLGARSWSQHRAIRLGHGGAQLHLRRSEDLEQRLPGPELVALLRVARLLGGRAPQNVLHHHASKRRANLQKVCVGVRAFERRLLAVALQLEAAQVRLLGGPVSLSGFLEALDVSGGDFELALVLEAVDFAQQRPFAKFEARFCQVGFGLLKLGGAFLAVAALLRFALLDLVLQRYLDAGRKLLTLRPRLAALEEPCLQLVLTPSSDRGAMVAAELSARSFREEGFLNVAAAHAQTAFPLLGEAPFATRVTMEIDHLDWRTQAQIESLHVELDGSLVPDRFAFKPQLARVTAAGGTAMGFPLGAPVAELGLTQLPRLRGDVSVRAGGAPLAAHGDLDLKKGEGSLALSGSLTPALLRLAADRSKLALANKLALSEPAVVEARIELAPGWKPARAEADVSVRHLVAQDVPLDAVSGHAIFADHELSAIDIAAVQGDNAAYGSYEMDTITRDYRFLLKGRMRPPDIAGWFKPSWLRFWSNFDFSAAPPDADVDVSGRWGSTGRSRVYCRVDAVRPEIRGVPFDRLGTTLFFRPNYYNVSALMAERAGHFARGSFIVTLDPQLSTYRTLDFAGDSELDIAECARLYGPAGTELFAPYQFAEPPSVHLTGHFDGPGMPGGPHKRVKFTVTSHALVLRNLCPLRRIGLRFFERVLRAGRDRCRSPGQRRHEQRAAADEGTRLPE